MTEAKFTPGPWFIECDGLPELRNVSTYITAGSGDDHVLICEVNTDAPDARLLAAAPAMYEALMAAAAVMEAHDLMTAKVVRQALRLADVGR